MFMVQEYIKDKWHAVQVFMSRADAEAYVARFGGNARIKDLSAVDYDAASDTRTPDQKRADYLAQRAAARERSKQAEDARKAAQAAAERLEDKK